MKTKRAMREYNCKVCGAPISKGDQYARKTMTLGQQGIAFDGTVKVWEPLRVAMPVCSACANPEHKEPQP